MLLLQQTLSYLTNLSKPLGRGDGSSYDGLDAPLLAGRRGWGYSHEPSLCLLQRLGLADFQVQLLLGRHDDSHVAVEHLKLAEDEDGFRVGEEFY